MGVKAIGSSRPGRIPNTILLAWAAGLALAAVVQAEKLPLRVTLLSALAVFVGLGGARTN